MDQSKTTPAPSWPYINDETGHLTICSIQHGPPEDCPVCSSDPRFRKDEQNAKD